MAKVTKITELELKSLIDALQDYFDDPSGAFTASEWYDFQALWNELRNHLEKS